MKISKKEKILIAFLGLFLIGYLYYEYGYKTLVKLVDNKKIESNEIETKYNKAKETIDSMETQKTNVKILNAKILHEAAPLYPTLSQEHIIIEIDKLIKESGLEGGMTFEKIEVKAVEAIKKASNQDDLPESSIQSLTDYYKYKFVDKDKTNVSDASTNADVSNNENSTDKNSNSNSETTQNTDSGEIEKPKENTIAQLKMNMDFNGSYASVVKFLNALGNYEKKIPAYTINISTKNLQEVKGSINMIIYAVPKIDDDISQYLIWSLNNTYGKGQPFVINSAVGTGIKSTNEISDFIISAKSINSELPTVIMGRANDTLRTSYVYADGNNEQQAEIILTKNGDKYYYKYKTLTWKMPEKYDGQGSEFVPNSENININVFSEKRVNSDDKSGLKIKIVNTTDKLVNVNISGEDLNDPRISIEGDSTNININQK